MTMVLVGVVELSMWQYASANRRLLIADVTDLQIKGTQWRTYYMIAVFGLSILIALVSPLLAMLFTRALVSRLLHQ